MVQVIEQAPGLAELLGAGVSQGLQTGLATLLEEKKKKAQLDSLNKLLNLQQESPQAPEEGSLVSGKQEPPRQTNVERIATNPQAMMALSQINPQAASQVQKMYDSQLAREKFEFEKEKEEKKKGEITPEKKEQMKDVFRRQVELLGSGNIGLAASSSLLTEKGREERAEFDTLGASIEAALLPLLNKGVLSKPRFDFILKNIPKSTDTIGKIKGKMKALSREFNIEQPSFEETQKELSREMAEKFLKAAQGDKEKAREQAKKAGFNF